MSPFSYLVRRNRIMALRAVAARNSDPADIKEQPTKTIRESRRAKFSVIETPWQPEDLRAA